MSKIIGGRIEASNFYKSREAEIGHPYKTKNNICKRFLVTHPIWCFVEALKVGAADDKL